MKLTLGTATPSDEIRIWQLPDYLLAAAASLRSDVGFYEAAVNNSSRVETSGSRALQAGIRIRIDMNAATATIDGVQHPLGFNQLLFLAELVRADGLPVRMNKNSFRSRDFEAYPNEIKNILVRKKGQGVWLKT